VAYPPPEVLRRGQKIVRAIGFEAGEERRTYIHVVKAIGLDVGEEHRLTWARKAPDKKKRLSREQWLDQNYFVYWYPLMDWGYDRETCKRIIAQAGLPVPVKSSCFYCPGSKKHEIVSLQGQHPDLLGRALKIEQNAQAKLTSVKGLGRSFSWQGFLGGRRINLP
jgi:hypothetical protein